MKLLKSPFSLIAKIGTLITLCVIVLYIAGIISFPNKAIQILVFALLGGFLGILAYTIECGIKRKRLAETGLCFEGRILSINEVYIGFKIGGAKCCKFGYSYLNNEGETITGTGRIVYMGRDYFSYVKNLSEAELNQRFKVKVYVNKGNKNDYISEVYKIG